MSSHLRHWAAWCLGLCLLLAPEGAARGGQPSRAGAPVAQGRADGDGNGDTAGGRLLAGPTRGDQVPAVGGLITGGNR
jgi:hypothetical protein